MNSNEVIDKMTETEAKDMLKNIMHTAVYCTPDAFDSAMSTSLVEMERRGMEVLDGGDDSGY